MNRKINAREACLYLICALLVIGAFATGVLNKGVTWADMPREMMTFINDGQLRYSLADGDDYGVKSYGPYLDLPAGTYRFKFRIDGDGENIVRMEAENKAKITPCEMKTTPDNWDGEYWLEIPEAADNVQILVEFASGTWMEVIDIRLYTPEYTDHAWTLLFFLAALCIGYSLYIRGFFTPDRSGRLVLMGLAVLLASVPALKENLAIGHDTTFHLTRIENLADGLHSGQFPVRAGGFTYNGYGAITSVFYPDLFLYPSALMMLGGASIQYAVHVYLIAVNILSAATMYACAKRVFEDAQIGACASILYTLSIYRLTDVMTRHAFGEMTAMAMFPLFLLGLWEIALGDKRRWKLLVLGATGIFQSHMLSTLLAAMTAVGFCLIYARRILKEKRVGSIVKACAATLLLNLFSIIPLLMYSAQEIGASGIAMSMENSTIAPAQLFLMGSGQLAHKPNDESIARFSLEIGFPLVLGAVLALYAAVTERKKGQGERFALLCAAAGAFCALLATELFPWLYASILTGGLADYLQFPWRFLMLTAVLFALASAYGYMHIPGMNGQMSSILVLALCAVVALPLQTTETRNDSYIAYGEGTSPKINNKEYNLPGTDVERTTTERSPLIEGEIELTQYDKRGTQVSAQVNAQSDAVVDLPMFGFDGYAAEVNGERMETGLGENNRLRVQIPAGTQGTLRVWFEGKAIWRVGDVISLATAIALALTSAGKRKRAAA